MSSIAKAELRRAALVEFGVEIEHQITECEQAEQRATGGKQALEEHAKNMLQLMASAKAELLPKDQEVTERQQEDAKLVLKWLNRAVEATTNAAAVKGNGILIARGMVRAAERSHDLLQKATNKEQVTIEAAQRAIAEAQQKGDGEAVEGDSRRPGPSIKQQRQAEEATGKKPVRTPVVNRRKRAKNGVANATHT